MWGSSRKRGGPYNAAEYNYKSNLQSLFLLFVAFIFQSLSLACSTLPHPPSHYNTLQYNTNRHYNTLQYNTIQIQYITIQYNTIQYNTIQYKHYELEKDVARNLWQPCMNQYNCVLQIGKHRQITFQLMTDLVPRY